jgi:hypothetical protein
MPKIDCLECKHWRDGYLECEYGFRSAATAGGSAADCKEYVWSCRDYEEKEENEYDG